MPRPPRHANDLEFGRQLAERLIVLSGVQRDGDPIIRWRPGAPTTTREGEWTSRRVYEAELRPVSVPAGDRGAAASVVVRAIRWDVEEHQFAMRVDDGGAEDLLRLAGTGTESVAGRLFASAATQVEAPEVMRRQARVLNLADALFDGL